MTRWYLDASVALHAVLPGGDERAGVWLDAAVAERECYSSVLLTVELARVLRRESLDPTRANSVVDRVDLVVIDDAILRAAAALEPHVKTLDAIHLATCALLGPQVTLATHDASMAAAARALGIDFVDPVKSDTAL